MIKKIKFALLLFIFVCLTSCLYKMPTDDTYSLIPKTNNPNFIGDEQNPMPNQAPF